MSGLDTAARVAALNSDAKAHDERHLDLYRARLSWDELALRIPTTNTTELVKVSGIHMDAFYKGVANKVRRPWRRLTNMARPPRRRCPLNSVASASTVGFS